MTWCAQRLHTKHTCCWLRFCHGRPQDGGTCPLRENVRYKTKFALITTFWFTQKEPKSFIRRFSSSNYTSVAIMAIGVSYSAHPDLQLDLKHHFVAEKKGQNGQCRRKGKGEEECRGEGMEKKGRRYFAPPLQEFLRVPMISAELTNGWYNTFFTYGNDVAVHYIREIFRGTRIGSQPSNVDHRL